MICCLAQFLQFYLNHPLEAPQYLPATLFHFCSSLQPLVTRFDKQILSVAAKLHCLGLGSICRSDEHRLQIIGDVHQEPWRLMCYTM